MKMSVPGVLCPSPTRHDVEPNIRDSSNKVRRKPSKHHKIRKARHITEETRRLGCWGSELKSGRGRGGRAENDMCSRLYSGDFDNNKLPKLEPVAV